MKRLRRCPFSVGEHPLELPRRRSSALRRRLETSPDPDRESRERRRVISLTRVLARVGAFVLARQPP